MHNSLRQPTDHSIQSRLSISISQLKSILFRVDWRGVFAFTLPFTLYMSTLAPTIYNLDSAELTTAAATGGLMRATGYPLYLTLSKLWLLLPVGDVGYRMNLFSAMCGALTIFLADQILRRWRVSVWASMGALGLLASGTFFWGMSLIAEVYTLHTALMAGLIYCLLRWGDNPTPRRLLLVGLIGGMGLSHHAATFLLIPGSLFYVLVLAPKQALSPRSLFAAGIGVLIGLSFYLYLPLSYLGQPAFNYAGIYDADLVFHPINLLSPGGLFWLISGKSFAGQMLAYHGSALWHELVNYIVQLSQAFFIFGLLPGILGALTLLRRDWKAGLMLGLMFTFSAAFYIDYRVIDKNTMFLPSYLVWSIWIGLGYQKLLDWLRQGDLPLRQSRGFYLIRGAPILIVLFAVLWNWSLVNLSNDYSARQRGEAILSRIEQGALVLGWWDTVPVIQYLQLVEGQRPDVQAINRFLISQEDLYQYIRKEVTNRSIYIDSPPTELIESFDIESIGPIYKIQPPH